MRANSTKLSSQEELLLDYGRRLQRHRAGRMVFWLHLSRLAPENRHITDLRLAANLLRPLASEGHGDVFLLRSGDVVMTLKNPSRPVVDGALFQVRYTFAHDDLMRRADDEGDEVYLSEYKMETDYDVFIKACKDQLQRAMDGGSTKEDETEEPTNKPVPTGPRLVVAVSQEGAAKTDAETAPVAVKIGETELPLQTVSQRRSIYTIDEDERQLAIGLRYCVPDDAIDHFGELALSLARGQITKPNALVEIERYIAPVLVQDLVGDVIPISMIAIRLQTVMTPDFAKVLRALESRTSTQVWLAIDAEDVRDDLETANYVFDFLRKRGITFGLSNLTPATARHVVRQLAGASFAEIEQGSSEALPMSFAASLIRLLDNDNVIIGASVSKDQHKDLCEIGARRFVCNKT